MFQRELDRLYPDLVGRSVDEAVKSARGMGRASIELELQRAQKGAEQIKNQSRPGRDDVVDLRVGQSAEDDGSDFITLGCLHDLINRLASAFDVVNKRNRHLAQTQVLELGKEGMAERPPP